MAIAGVREYIFVWNIATEQLIKHFQGHYGRIIRMSSLIEGKWNHAVTSSMDRTIKVWDMTTIEEAEDADIEDATGASPTPRGAPCLARAHTTHTMLVLATGVVG